MPPAESLFEHEGGRTFVPTAASIGPWHEATLHGGAVSALLAGLLEVEGEVLVRLLLELLAPVPAAPLAASIGEAEGGRRVARQSVTLLAGDRPVARASALRMRGADQDLPERATRHPITFDPAAAPDLSEPNRAAIATIGRESFDSLALAVASERDEGSTTVRMWNRLLLPVVPGRPPTPVEQLAAACDNASGVGARLPFREWSFVNADLVISVSRAPVGDWIGLESDGLIGPSGTGQAVSSIHDALGRLGQKSSSVLVARR